MTSNQATKTIQTSIPKSVFKRCMQNELKQYGKFHIASAAVGVLHEETEKYLTEVFEQANTLKTGKTLNVEHLQESVKPKYTGWVHQELEE